MAVCLHSIPLRTRVAVLFSLLDRNDHRNTQDFTHIQISVERILWNIHEDTISDIQDKSTHSNIRENLHINLCNCN